jgi:septum formation protein
MRPVSCKLADMCMNERLRAIGLASQSPRRKALLESVGLAVTIVPSSYNEEDNLDAATDPSEIALRHALGKARQAQGSGPPVLVAADTIVEIAGELLGKPRDPAAAHAMLRKLSGREHQVYTGFIVLDRASGCSHSGVESTAVRFMALDDDDITAYVATGDPLDKAGAYGIQGRGGLLVSSIQGDFYTVMGLPLARVGAALRELGYDVLAR